MINALYGFNKSDGTNRLLAIRGGKIVKYNDAGGWASTSAYVTSSAQHSFETFLDTVFLVNGVDANRTYNGTSWSTTTLISDAPKAYVIVRQGVRLFLLKPEILGTSYKSRVWFSDLPGEVTNNGLTWGFESGTNLSQTISTAVVTSSGSTFLSNNIKVGDPFYITTGDNAGKYVVQSVDSETQITLTSNVAASATNSSFWVGSNWFDVNTNDSDQLVTAIEAFNELVLYKKNSVHRYNQYGQELRQIKNTVGTTSFASVIANKGYVYHYHPSVGIIRIDGTQGIEISGPVQDLVDGVSDTTAVVGWVEKDKILNWYLGDVTTREGESITDCVITFNTVTNQWSHKQLPYQVTAATTWYVSDVKKTYIGTDTNYVYLTPTGSSFGTVPISMDVRTFPIFPAGENVTVDFRRLRIFLERPSTFQVMYRLIYLPLDDSKTVYYDETDWHSLKGNTQGTRVELTFSRSDGGPVRASGVELMFLESSSTEGPLIEKMILYYSEGSDV